MISSWREKLPPLEDVYDRRMISLGRRDPGVYLVEAVHGDLRAFGILIVTDIATVQKTARDGSMLVYAVERKTGQPRAGVKVLVVRKRADLVSGSTDKQGLLKLQVVEQKPPAPAATAEEEEEEPAEDEEVAPEVSQGTDSYLVMATEGDNFAISDLESYYFGGYGEDEAGTPELTSLVYTDRPVYRPEQKVYFKGIIRERTAEGYRLPPGKTAAVTVTDQTGATIFEQELPVSTRGTFSGELDLPEESPLGSYTISASVGGASADGYFTVEEYKKPEYKVRVTTPQGYVRAGERTRFTVSANYFFGAPVTKASVKYYVYRSRHYDWWDGSEGGDEEDDIGADPTAEEGDNSYYYGSGDEMMLEGDGKLNEQGRLEVDFQVPPPDAKDRWDYRYRLEAEVTDAARRSMSASASLTGIRSNVTVSAVPDRYVYGQGDPARVSVHARDREGRPVQTRVRLTFYERRWQKVVKKDESGYEYPEYSTKEKELSSASVETNAEGEGSFDYVAPAPGSILIRSTIEEAGKPVVMEAGSLWVADRDGRWEDVSYDAEGEIKLVLDKKSYKPGETARVLALLPKEKAHLLITTELDGVLGVRQMDVAGRAAIIDVPIEARFAPNVFLNITYVRGSEMYTQEVEISVPARDKMLKLEIIPNKKEFRPRETASYTVFARNADGSPAAGAEVSLGVVDESVYSIAPESSADIRRVFYGQRYSSVATSFSVNYYFSGYAGQKTVNLAQKKRARQLADFKDESANPLVRKIFKDTAFWQPALVTGADGKAQAKFELPDNLTTWRATARAVTPDLKVGLAVSKVVERKDVIIRVATPRFLTAGDTVTLSGIVHNYLKTEKVTKISIEVAGARLLDPAQQTVTIPSQGEHRVNWRVSAPATGELKILAKALTDAESDALETGIPIVPRGLKFTRADSFAFAEDEADKTVTFTLPANADANARSLRVEVSPTVAGTLFGALDYLTSYPYGCTEQTMSSFLPNVIVTQALQNVRTTSVRDTNDVGRKVRRGLKRLYGFQHGDGGWGWWKDDQTTAWMTAYVVDGLVQAGRAGYEIDATRLENGRAALRKMLETNADGRGAIEPSARAYMAYALAQSGEAEMRHLNQLFGERGELGAYARAMLALGLKERDDRRAAAVAGEIERAAKGSGGDAHWDNNAEATALSVKALARILPQSEVLPRAARWLVGHRRHGHYWLSTRDTAFAIYGLIDYVRVSNEMDPDYALEVYVGGQQVLQKQVTAADPASMQPFTLQRRGGEVGQASEVRVVKRGRGMLYLATALTHHTDDEQTAEAGVPQLKLRREYLRLKVAEKSDGTLGWALEPLSGDVRSGDIIVSRLLVEGAKSLYLMIEDPIPAGCEQVQSVSGIELDHTETGWSDWYSAREFRDNRAVFFRTYLDGKAQFQYAMRVQVPGQFRVAPSHVERMYEPDVRANSASAALTILDR
jgi:uncharacterized protein YfaS (alpha-2-macroglobulin family)